MKKKAFTLIELLVVVAIIGILAAVGVTTFNGFQEKAKKRATEANHKIIAKYIQSEWMKCQIGDAAIMSLNGVNQYACNQNIYDPWLALTSVKVLNTKIKNVYKDGNALVNRTFYKCYASGTYGTEEQGLHGVTQGNAKIYIQTCIESSGTPIETIINLL